jgi:hypothetical protein
MRFPAACQKMYYRAAPTILLVAFVDTMPCRLLCQSIPGALAAL